MSVSARDRKAVIYSEVERQRQLLDQQAQQLRAQDQQLRAQSEEIERLRAQGARPQAPDISKRRAQLNALKAFATKYRCTSRLRDGVIELYSKKRSCWVAVPEGTQP